MRYYPYYHHCRPLRPGNHQVSMMYGIKTFESSPLLKLEVGYVAPPLWFVILSSVLTFLFFLFAAAFFAAFPQQLPWLIVPLIVLLITR